MAPACQPPQLALSAAELTAGFDALFGARRSTARSQRFERALRAPFGERDSLVRHLLELTAQLRRVKPACDAPLMPRWQMPGREPPPDRADARGHLRTLLAARHPLAPACYANALGAAALAPNRAQLDERAVEDVLLLASLAHGVLGVHVRLLLWPWASMCGLLTPGVSWEHSGHKELWDELAIAGWDRELMVARSARSTPPPIPRWQ